MVDRRGFWLCWLVSFSACAGGPRPNNPGQGPLFRDLQRLVRLSETTGWEIDALKVDALLAEALASTCRTPEPTQGSLLTWLDREIVVEQGPAKSAYQRNGGDLDAIDRLLELERIAMVLRAARDRRTECPFWIHPNPNFSGLQILDNQWVFSVGGGGIGIITSQGSRQDVRAGGAGRLMLGRGIGLRWLLQSGLEIGGAASFPRNPQGQREGLVLGMDIVVPLVARYRFVNSYFEFESGYLAHVDEEDWSDVQSGVRAGLAFGAQGARRLSVLPGVALGLSVERLFAEYGEPPAWAIKVGLRAAIDISLTRQ